MSDTNKVLLSARQQKESFNRFLSSAGYNEGEMGGDNLLKIFSAWSEAFESLQSQLKQKDEALREVVELIEKAYPIIVQYKYKSAIDKHETDVKWSVDWQEKAKECLAKLGER